MAEKGISLTFVADELGISKSTLSNWVNDRANWPSHIQTKITELTGYQWPEDATDLIDPRITPEQVGEAFTIVSDGLRAARIPLDAIPPMKLGLLAGLTAQELARGQTGEATKRMLVERAKILLAAYPINPQSPVGPGGSQ